MAKAKRKRLRNIHPGEVLMDEFLIPLELSQYQLAKQVRVPLTRIAEICRGKRAVSADTALRLAKFFGNSSKFWLGLQEDYDLEEEAIRNADALAAIHPYEYEASKSLT